MRILSRYFFMYFYRWFGLVLLGCSAIICIFESSELLRRGSNKSFFTFGLLGQMVLLKLVHLLHNLLPLIILFSAILAFSRLNRSHQILIARLSGLSFWQVMSPFLAASLVLVFLQLTILNPLAASSMRYLQKLDDYYFQHQVNPSIILSENGLWFNQKLDSISRIIHLSKVDIVHQVIEGVDIYEFRNSKFLRQISAQKLVFEDDTWRLSGCLVIDEEHPYSQQEIVLTKMLNFINIDNAINDAHNLSLWDIIRSLNLIKNLGIDDKKFVLQYHFILAKSAINIIMIIIAALLTLRYSRRQYEYKSVFYGITIGFLSYVFSDVFYSFGSSGVISPILAAWTVPFVITLIAIAGVIYYEE